jgi:glycosyltransferase involved in cell wall biosynthesis
MKKLAVVIMMRNESLIIERCLRSIAPVADLVIITDTGSTDDSIIRAGLYLQSQRINYKIYKDSFIDFAYNRNLLLKLARAEEVDFVLMIDCDEIAVWPEGFDPVKWKNELRGDYYDITMKVGNIMYNLPRLTYNSTDLNYVGVTHEYLHVTGFYGGIVPSLEIHQINDSKRRVTNRKFKDDAELLEAALKTEKEDGLRRRYMFYLAQTYHALGDFKNAKKYYIQRAKMGGWKDEEFYCLYQLGKIAEHEDSSEVSEYYIKAYETLPTRVESLAALRDYRRRNGSESFAQMLHEKITHIPKPLGGLFIEEDKYVCPANPISVSF